MHQCMHDQTFKHEVEHAQLTVTQIMSHLFSSYFLSMLRDFVESVGLCRSLAAIVMSITHKNTR